MCDYLSFLVHRDAESLPKGDRYLFGDLTSHSSTARLHRIVYDKRSPKSPWLEAEWVPYESFNCEDAASVNRGRIVVRRDKASQKELARRREAIRDDFNGDFSAFARFALRKLPANCDSQQRMCLCHVAGRYRLPAGVDSLRLQHCYVAANTQLPETLDRLIFGGCTLATGFTPPAGLRLFASGSSLGVGGKKSGYSWMGASAVTYMALHSESLPRNIIWPENLQVLSLYDCVLPVDLKLPKTLKALQIAARPGAPVLKALPAHLSELPDKCYEYNKVYVDDPASYPLLLA